MYKSDVFNLETMKTRLRDLNNRAQTCKTIPEDFRSKYTTLSEWRNYVFIDVFNSMVKIGLFFSWKSGKICLPDYWTYDQLM